MTVRPGLALLVVPVLVACSPSGVLPTPRAFNRPARAAFVCFEGSLTTGVATPTSLDRCAQTAGLTPPGFSRVALVAQQTRGEVAAVDLTPIYPSSTTPVRVLDSDPRVPGFTFVEVGEVPTAIVVSETSPACTWVANRGSRDIYGIETERFVHETRTPPAILDLHAAVAAVRPSPDAGAAVPASGRPQAMVLLEGATSQLIVTLPEDGLVARVTVDPTACTFVGTELLDLPAVPPPPAGGPPAPGDEDSATLAICPASAAGQVIAPEAAVALTAWPPSGEPEPAPMPLEATVERDWLGRVTGVLIGDAARPTVYRYEVASGRFVPGYRTDGPVRDLVMTPRVPDHWPGTLLASGACESTPPTRRYLYAIDHVDGTVMVLDGDSGHVLPLQPADTQRPARLSLLGPARALEVIDTRDLPAGACDVVAGSPTFGPGYLRGVSIGVLLSDSTLRIVDVLDADAVCRADDPPCTPTGASSCTTRFIGVQQVSFVRRHRPRLSGLLAHGVVLAELPSATVAGAAGRYLQDGSPEATGTVPSFVDLGSCPAGLGRLDSAAAPFSGVFLCGLTDPWSGLAETWQLSWQGTIPFTQNTGGLFADVDDGRIALDTQTDVCAAGVLGPGAVPGYPGDLLAFTGSLVAPYDADPICRALLALDTGTSSPPLVALDALVTSYGEAMPDAGLSAGARTRFVIRRGAEILERGPVTQGGTTRRLTIEDVRRCFDEAGGTHVSYDVRTHGAFTVVGSRTGFLHGVGARAGRCEAVDPDPLLSGRAFLGEPFRSRRLAFQLDYPVDPATMMPARPAVVPRIDIRFDVTDVPAVLGVDLDVMVGMSPRPQILPTEMTWSRIDHRLYVVGRGLGIVDTQPLAINRFVE